MTTTTAAVRSESGVRSTLGYPASTRRFDWTIAALSAWIVGGLYLDGWAHNHGRVDDVFFTPWHAILYSGVAVTVVVLLSTQLRNTTRGYDWSKSLPQGYLLSLVGAGLFMLGGALDFVWHTLFGIEVNLETLLSPTHLFLATSGVLMISGPLRAAWARLSRDELNGWKSLGPAVISATLVLSLLTFFTEFAHPISTPSAGKTAPDTSRFGDLYLMKADGTGQTRLTADPNLYAGNGAWSPDGRQIVFSRGQVGESLKSELYIMNADGSDSKELVDLPGAEYLPAWSPDGKQIAFTSYVENKNTIYTIDINGANLKHLTPNGVNAYGPVWSPDGSQIAYTSETGTSQQLFLMNADGSNPTQMTFKGMYTWGATWSPDGSQIAFNSMRDDNTDLFVIQKDGSREKRLTDDPGTDFMPAWSPDGTRIAAVAWRDDNSNIFVMNADGSNYHDVTHNHTLDIENPKWSPDGKTIMYSARGHSAITSDRPSFAIVSLLFQSALLMGVVLMLVRQWNLPVGALAFLFAVNGLLMSLMHDHYALALAWVGAGLVAELLNWQLKPSAERPGRLSLFAFIMPVVFSGLYFLALQLTQGMDWTIHLWLGTIFMAGIVGLFVSMLVVMPLLRHSSSASNLNSRV